MPDRHAISVESLSKAYRIGAKEEIPDTLMSAVGGGIRYPLRNFHRLRNLSNLREGDDGADVLWALRGVSFEVAQGDVVGIIGRNGAGKSTLLKILSRITDPTSGRAVIHGRVSSLLEVGTGFHPELSGRENIYMNGTILGMTKREIDRKFDEIVDFSGVEKFLDTPTKRYSSGMQVRLAFAVAAHLEPEILVIDEVLAVGDIAFQQKCLAKMKNVATSGRTVLFVSHNLTSVAGLCSRAVVLDDGAVSCDGSTEEAIAHYHALQSVAPAGPMASRRNKGALSIERVYLEDLEGTRVATVPMGGTAKVAVEIDAQAAVADCRVAMFLASQNGQRLLRLRTDDHGHTISLPEGRHTLHCRIERVPLLPGNYELSCTLLDAFERPLDRLDPAATLGVGAADVLGSGRMPGKVGVDLVFLKSEWEFSSGVSRDTGL